ncbi:hypothetical protein D3C79_517450 [compost metagenome]
MGTYTQIVCQRKIGDKWFIVLPEGLGYNPEIPHSYGKLDPMDKIDREMGINLDGRTRLHSRRQDFQSPGEFAEPSEYAPWAKRGLPEDADDEIKELFEDEFQDSISWVMLDELLSYDFDKELVSTTYHDQEKVSWTEMLKPSYRMWFERLKEIGVERVIYSNH